MKNYFCKYLPVEGEIKDGGKYWNRQWQKADDVVGDIHVKVLQNGNFQPAKLFLCSRDIQVGDKVTVEGFHSEAWFSIVATLSYITESNQVCLEEALKRSSYKVIGEISPEATWVKEGDEFEEKQLEIWANNGEYKLKSLSDYRDHKKIEITIKCPTCAHFH